MPDFQPRGYVFHDGARLTQALTHSSYANENKDKGAKSNERLEFLGDSVLGFLCAEHLYSAYGDLPEGELTQLRAATVREESLYAFALEIGLGEHLLLGRGEKAAGGSRRPSVLADAVEAVLAAVYLDGGMAAARGFIMDFIIRKSGEAASARLGKDYKTALQEIVQKNHQETLSYRLKGESGPDHDKRFVVEALINRNPIAEGVGKSKKLAEQAAARAALVLMGEEPE
jgi:ribonuclease-3